MRKLLSPVLSAAVLGGALLLCPPSSAAVSTPSSARISTSSAVYQMPARMTCITLGTVRSC